MTVARFGVVVPAWNEADVLPALLASLLAQEGVELDVVIVANGCADATAEVARAMIGAFAAAGHRLQVVEIVEPSKPAALRAGDAAVATLPKAYVDADVALSPTALQAVAAPLDTSHPRAAAPRLRFAAPANTARLAAFVESASPFRDDVVGGGFYAVNAAGRARWGDFPDLVADDAFVLGLFARSERRLVRTAEFRCRFPDRQRLPAVLARWEFGRRQAAEAGSPGPPSRRVFAILQALAQPARWPQAWQWFRLKRAARAYAAGRSAADIGWAHADR
ncbi:glycosyltransferase [Phenylobacterium sp.]|uniref:glycosyltransferase n=1 Tax=Phenylobacterium sp. TaxID=1871053 RepID=UPI002EDB5384